MALSVYSLFMAVLWSSVLTVLLYAFRKRRTFLMHFGVYNITLLYLFSVSRMLLPLEFPFTKEFPLAFILNPVSKALRTTVVSMSGVQVTLGNVLLVGWLCVALFLVIQFIKAYLEECRRLSYLKENQEQRLQEILQNIQYNSSRFLKVTLLTDSYMDSPKSIGLIRKRILLPQRQYTDAEISFILQHEYQHFLNRDLLLKWLIHLYCCLFWWNPCAHLLKRDLEQMLEVKCDLKLIAERSDEKKADYLATILKVYQDVQLQKEATGGMAFLGLKKKSSLEERFLLISQSNTRKRYSHLFQIAFSLAVLTLFVVSYLFVAQSSFETPIEEIETTESAIALDNEDMLIQKNSDGTYIMHTQYLTQEISLELAQQLMSQGVKLIENGE